MHKLAITVVAASLAFVTPAFADDAHHPDKGQATKAAPAKPAAKTTPAVPKMQAQLERIAKAKTDEERAKAIAEHMQTMRESMNMARGAKSGMMDCPMMQSAMMGGGMDTIEHAGTPGNSSERMQMKPHSHLEEKTGILRTAPEAKPDRPNAATDRTKHFHPRDGK